MSLSDVVRKSSAASGRTGRYIDLMVEMGQTDAQCIKNPKRRKGNCVEDLCVLPRICIFMCSPRVCMQMNEPVFLKGKSSLFSIGDGRAYWQVGDVPPCGGELWSSDVWWEDLMKAVRRNRLFSYRWFESWYLCRVLWQEEKKHTYVYQSFWWWTTEWLTPLPVGSLADLLNRNSWSFCFTSLLATAPVRPKGGKQKGLRLP